MGKECKVSGRPFTSFRWQGQHKRWKETCVSPDVAREKDVCQWISLAESGSQEHPVVLLDSFGKPELRWYSSPPSIGGGIYSAPGSCTPLHLAALHGHLEVARVLLVKGADPNAIDECGLTPLHWAASHGHDAVVSSLLSHGAQVDAKNEVS